MRGLQWMAGALAGLVVLASGPAGRADESYSPSAERGRAIMTDIHQLPPDWRAERAPWSADAYKKVGKLWGEGAPDPDEDPAAYAAAFNRRYGLHPAPFPNDGLPMGLRLTRGADGRPDGGLITDCLLCHGGSIGGTSYVGLGNSQLDTVGLFRDLTRADGKPVLPAPFVVNTSRGTVNAGQMAVFLLSFRNTDLSRRRFPLMLGVNFPEIDTPPWWNLGRKETKYYDGRTDARDHRSNMQFHLGAWDLEQFRRNEDAFKDIQAYLTSLRPPKYPFAIDAAKAERGKAVFERNCRKCHGSYGPGGSYPNRIVELDVIGTDPLRATEVSRRSVDHYNATWFGELYQVDTEMTGYQAPPLDGVWATAPYLHNGSVPTVYHLLKSSERPARYKRPPSTDFEHYDRDKLGWTFEPVDAPPDPGLPPHEARFVFDASRRGLGNGGHTFGDRLSEDDRMDLIEYLKTL